MTRRPGYIPQDYDRINVVDNPDQLKQPFDGGAVNCRLLPRPLPAAIDFARAACAIADATPRARLDRGSLAGLRANLPPEARDAADFIIDDMDRFPAAELRVIRSDTYYGINTPDAISGRFHADRISFPLFSGDTPGRLLCCYNGAVTQGLRNDQAQRAAARPGVNAYVRRLGTGRDRRPRDILRAEDYTERSLYFPLKKAEIFSFANGDLWLQAAEVPGKDAGGFIHRAPPGPLPRRAEDPSKTVPRLLLVGT